VNIAIEDQAIEHDVNGQRFEVRRGDEIARLEYRLQGSTISFTHTIVPRSLDNQGVAAMLVRHALEYARENGLMVAPLCPYVAYYIGQHPEFKDLLASWTVSTHIEPPINAKMAE
jgi:predicted GNAT family acetyltransferase